MNKKLILAAMAVVLTAGCSQAATNITGVTGTNGVYNITPEHFSGIAGYRKYDNFTLDQGDKANLQFVRNQEGKSDPTAFVNLVQNKVNINGVLNTVDRDGAFCKGHAIFITPGGFVVGQSGVLNVGRLSVATPTTATYNKLLKDSNNNNYGDANFDYAQAIGRNVSKLTQNSDVANLPSNNAEVTVDGYVFTRAGAELGGKAVAVPGHIVNGVKAANAVESLSDAETLFGTLVNTNGTVKSASNFQAQGGRILLKSSDSLNVSGTVTNGTGETYLTNNGTNGLAVSGKVAGTTYARLYNTKGDLAVNNGAYVSAAQVDARNQSGAAALTLASGSTLNGTEKVQVKNQGSGALTTAGTLSGKGTFTVKNYGSGMTVGGTVTNSQGDTAIRNYNGTMVVNAAITNSNGNMGIINEGSGMTVGGTSEIKNTGKLKIANKGTSGLTVYGKVDNTGETRIYNDAGKLTLGTSDSNSATITNKNGKLYIASRKDATGLSQSAGSTISNTGNNLVIRNSGTNVASDANGLDLQGTISSSNGILAINNDYGKMNVSSNITASNGNVGIINRSTAKAMTVSSGSLNVTGGNANVKNFGNGNMTVSSAITHNGRVNVLANKGKLTLGSKVTNNSGKLSDNGGFYAASRVDGTGIEVTNAFDASGAGEVLIKNISGSTNGLTYAGKIDTTGNQAALVNKNGQMTISGTMKTTNGQVVVSNRGKNAADNATKLTITKDAVFNSGTKGKLVNTGTQASDISKDATFTNMEQWEKITTDK